MATHILTSGGDDVNGKPPTTLLVQPEHIPAFLRDRARWIVWKWTRRAGRWTKPLFMAGPDRKPAASDDPSTWVSFEEAMASYLAHGWDGIGYVPVPCDNLTALDADKCRD